MNKLSAQNSEAPPDKSVSKIIFLITINYGTFSRRQVAGKVRDLFTLKKIEKSAGNDFHAGPLWIVHKFSCFIFRRPFCRI